MRSFCSAKASLIFSTKNISVFGHKVVKHLTSWPLNELVKLTMLWTTGPKSNLTGLGKEQRGLFRDISYFFIKCMLWPSWGVATSVIVDKQVQEFNRIQFLPVNQLSQAKMLQKFYSANNNDAMKVIPIRAQLFKTNDVVGNVLLKFQKLISSICQYFLLKKCEKLLQCKNFSNFFQQKISVHLGIKS